MTKFYKILFFNSLCLGTLIAISSYSWFGMWLGLEVNLLSIIPLMSSPKNLYPSESSIKYFITQSLASSMFLASLMLMMNTQEFIFNKNHLILILNSSLMLKLGAAPLHAWFPEVVEGLSWMNNFIMLTWQKISPMVILMYNLQINFFILIIMISSIISGLLGLNQISLRKIMAYSSINHIAWMLGSMLNFKLIWMIYFLIYSLITFNIIIIFVEMNMFYINQMFTTFLNFKSLKFLISLNFLSLGGLPPFLGFMPKWLTINNLVEMNLMFLSMILIIFTLITLYFYLRLTFSSFMIYTNETMHKTKKLNIFLISLNFLSLGGLLVCTLILNFY
nr:NADH dehydrogenase subunit 2 [Syneta adamsi]